MRRIANICSPRRILCAAFSDAACGVAAVTASLAMMFHGLTVADPITAGECIAADCLVALPWLATFVIRFTITNTLKKGGNA